MIFHQKVLFCPLPHFLSFHLGCSSNRRSLYSRSSRKRRSIHLKVKGRRSTPKKHRKNKKNLHSFRRLKKEAKTTLLFAPSSFAFLLYYILCIFLLSPRPESLGPESCPFHILPPIPPPPLFTSFPFGRCCQPARKNEQNKSDASGEKGQKRKNWRAAAALANFSSFLHGIVGAKHSSRWGSDCHTTHIFVGQTELCWLDQYSLFSSRDFHPTLLLTAEAGEHFLFPYIRSERFLFPSLLPASILHLLSFFLKVCQLLTRPT
jgi:hypothetical protein